jgi:Ca-activated chloride channel family protein
LTGAAGFASLSFTNSALLVWLFSLIPVTLFFFLHYRRYFPVISRLISGIYHDSGTSAKTPAARALLRRYLLSSLFFLLFVTMTICALAGPRMGNRLVREFRRGCDVVLALDISRSMVVRDAGSGAGTNGTGGAPSRLERSITIARDFVEASGDLTLMANLAPGGKNIFLRFALALGKGSGILAVPVSTDGEAVLPVLDAVSTSIMTSRGTNLEQLIDAALTGFVESSPASRQIVLFTDGESLSGQTAAAVTRAAQADIMMIAVGVGSVFGALIPESAVPSAGGRNVMVRSYLHDNALRSAVERAGGIYIDGNSDDAVRLLAEKIFPLAESSSWVFREESGSLTHIFILAGLVFLAVSVLITQRRHRRLSPPPSL